MTRSIPHRRGFATLIALAMLALVAAATAILLAHMRFAVIRTQAVSEDAQLRQLLAAGAQDVAGRAGNWGPQPPAANWSLELPSDLATGGATVAIQPDPATNDAQTVHIEAQLGPRRLTQSLRLRRTNEKWSPVGAEMDTR